jgi:uncharacterized membrane protein
MQHVWAPFTASLLASLVEFVEALTIVLAVGVVRGWRAALIGVAAGTILLAVLVGVFGPALRTVPITVLQLVIGILLLLFGMRWLRKAIMRSAGIIGMHDEAAIYAKQTAKLKAVGETAPARLDKIAAATTFKAVVLEGFEVVFIVIATGSKPVWLMPAIVGAALAGVIVILLGLVIHRPLARVPENTLKFAVGVILSSFGAFWIGEGLHFNWPMKDAFLGVLLGGFLLASIAGIALAESARKAQPARGGAQ